MGNGKGEVDLGFGGKRVTGAGATLSVSPVDGVPKIPIFEQAAGNARRAQRKRQWTSRID